MLMLNHVFHGIKSLVDFVNVEQGCQKPSLKLALSKRSNTMVDIVEKTPRLFSICALYDF